MARNLLRKRGETWEAEVVTRTTFLASPPDIEARPWRVLVFLGFRSPGLLDRAALDLSPGGLPATVPEPEQAGNAFQVVQGLSHTRGGPVTVSRKLTAGWAQALTGAQRPTLSSVPCKALAAEGTVQRRALFLLLRANQDLRMHAVWAE